MQYAQTRVMESQLVSIVKSYDNITNFPMCDDPEIRIFRKKLILAAGFTKNSERFTEIETGCVLHMTKQLPGTPITDIKDSYKMISNEDPISRFRMISAISKYLKNKKCLIFDTNSLKTIKIGNQLFYLSPVGSPGQPLRFIHLLMIDKAGWELDLSRRKKRMIFQTKMQERDPDGKLLVQRSYHDEKFVPAKLTNSVRLNRKAYLAGTLANGNRNPEGGFMGADAVDAFHQPRLNVNFLWVQSILFFGFVILVGFYGMGGIESSQRFDFLFSAMIAGITCTYDPNLWYLPVVGSIAYTYIFHFHEDLKIIYFDDVPAHIQTLLFKDANYNTKTKNLLCELFPDQCQYILTRNFVVVDTSREIYLDDLFLYYITLKSGITMLNYLLSALERAGFEMHPDKTIQPGVSFHRRQLGTSWDFVNSANGANEQKVRNLLYTCAQFFEKSSKWSSSNLQQVMGEHTFHAFGSNPELKSFCSGGYALLSGIDLEDKSLKIPIYRTSQRANLRWSAVRFRSDIIISLGMLLSKPFNSFRSLAGIYTPCDDVNFAFISDASGDKKKGWGMTAGPFYTHCLFSKTPEWRLTMDQWKGPEFHPSSSLAAEVHGFVDGLCFLIPPLIQHGFIKKNFQYLYSGDNLGLIQNFSRGRSKGQASQSFVVAELLRAAQIKLVLRHRYREYNNSTDRLAAADFSHMPLSPCRQYRMVAGHWRTFIPPRYKNSVLRMIYKVELNVRTSVQKNQSIQSTTPFLRLTRAAATQLTSMRAKLKVRLQTPKGRRSAIKLSSN